MPFDGSKNKGVTATELQSKNQTSVKLWGQDAEIEQSLRDKEVHKKVTRVRTYNLHTQHPDP